jgi:hypothetical protein
MATRGIFVQGDDGGEQLVVKLAKSCYVGLAFVHER